MTDSLHNMWPMLVVGPIYLAISAMAPLSDQIIFPRPPPPGSGPWYNGPCDTTAQKIPQSFWEWHHHWRYWYGECPSSAWLWACWGVSQHYSELRRAYRLQCRLTIPPSTLPSGIHFPVISYGFMAAPRGPWIPLGNPSMGAAPPPGHFSFGEPLVLPTVDCHWGPRHPWFCLGCGCLGLQQPFVQAGHAGERLDTHSPTLHMHLSARGVAAPFGNVLSHLYTLWG